jgi:hypothetical protein
MTNEMRLSALELEIARLRGRNRWLTCAVLAGLLAGLVGFAAPSSIGVVRATSFVLEDTNGRVRARQSVNGEGPLLEMLDDDGNIRLLQALTKAGPRFALVSEELGKADLLLSVAENQPRLSLSSQDGKTGVNLGVLKSGPYVHLVENGEIRIQQMVLDGGAVLTVHDEKGRVRCSQIVHKDGPALVLLDENQNKRAHLGLKDNFPLLLFFDAEAKMRLAQAVGKDGAKLVIYGENRQPDWTAP